MITIITMIILMATSPVIPASTTLTVNVTGFDSMEGDVVVLVFETDDGFPGDVSKAILTYSALLTSSTVSFTIESLESGTYAVTAFHDKNEDGKLNTNFLGRPTENVGASNLTERGRPNFSNASFELTDDILEIDISLF